MKKIDLTTSTNPLGPSNKARHAVRKAAKNLDTFPEAEAVYLTRLICKREHVDEKNVILGNGSTHLISLLIQVLRPETISVPSPFSPWYGEIFHRSGVQVRAVPLDEGQGFSFNESAFLMTLENSDTTVIPNPHDLTGAVMPMDTVQRLIDGADRMGKSLILDETYLEFTDCPSPISRIVNSSKSVVVRTFSLFHALAGLRIGYAIGPADLLEEVKTASFPSAVNSIGLRAALASLRDKGFRNRTLRFVGQEKVYISKKLAHVQGLETMDTACNFLLLKIADPPSDLTSLLEKKGILVEQFPGKDGVGYISLPVRKRRLTAIFMRALIGILKRKKE
jgi:threonine-phosphate decarboxylase